MNKVPFLDIVGPTYTLASLNAECQRCVNLYVEQIESGKGKNQYYLKPTPGLDSFIDLSDYPVKRLYTASNNKVYAIGGNKLYELFIDGSKILRGTLGIIPNHVRMVDNGILLFICYDNTAYTLRFSDNDFAIQIDAGYLGGLFVEFIDQYFITPVPGTQQFQISPLAYNRVTPWAAGDVFSCESNPDYITSMTINGREIWFFGPNSYEVWFNSEDSTRPFQRIRDAAFNIGTIAPFSVLSCAGQVFWLGGSKEGYGIIWSSSGYQPSRISNHGIEEMIASMGTIDDAEAWSYQVDGHFMYVISFPSEAKTLVYDITTKLWHEMEYRVPVYNTRLQHRAICHTFGFNKNLVGDFSNGNVYELSSEVYSDNGDPIIRYRRTPSINNQRNLIFYKKLELVIEPGVGLVSGQGSDPLISLRWSNDNGHTWSNYHTKSIGKIGKYKKPIVFNNLGAAIDRVFEIQISDPVPFRIISAEVGSEIGAH